MSSHRFAWGVLIAVLLSGFKAQAQPEVKPTDEPGLAKPGQPSPAPETPQTPPPPPAAAQPATPPPLPAATWYYMNRGQKAGPVTATQLRTMANAGQVPLHSLVWRPGFAQWRSLNTVPEFSNIGSNTYPPVHQPAPVMKYRTGPSVKPGDRQRIRGLVVAGSVVFGITWGLAVLGSFVTWAIEDDCSDCSEVAAVLWIPVAGPSIAAAVDNSDNAGADALLVFWTLTQAAGAAMLIAGLVGRKVEPRRVSSFFRPEEWLVAPMFGKINGIGLARSW